MSDSFGVKVKVLAFGFGDQGVSFGPVFEMRADINPHYLNGNLENDVNVGRGFERQSG